MANTGNVFAGSGANVDRGGTSNVWANPSRVTADDASTSDVSVPSDYLVCSGFNFSSIPDGSTINGVTVRVEAHETGSGNSNYIPQLISDTTPTLIGSPKSAVTVNNTTPVISSNGGTSDVWGATLTSAIVKNAGFGVAIWSTDTGNVLLIDFVTMAIEYTPPAKTASGTPSIAKPAASGSATQAAGAKTASGTPSIAKPTASGVAAVIRSAAGAVVLAAALASGAATVDRPASGTPNIALSTASGAATVVKTASGTPAVALVTASGSASVSAGSSEATASGTPSVAAIVSAGTANVGRTASGTPQAPIPTATGSAVVGRVASGAVTTAALTAAGSAVRAEVASGTPSLAALTSSGAGFVVRFASGTPSIAKPAASGLATTGNVAIAAGTSSAALPTASGLAGVTRHVSGALAVAKPTVSSFAVVERIASGAVETPSPTSAGSVVLGRTASGSPSIAPVQVSGQANLSEGGSMVITGTNPAPPLTAGQANILAMGMGFGAFTDPINVVDSGIGVSDGGQQVVDYL